ncbi:PrpF domain-containing protein [Actinoplanes couchii]|uniref:Uncharacterized protein n=1 Tax=Actinoplanes couchii TaxID=403638 RepID=A0ABQ3X134_9ACTN|nr:PrpF domain-containing protein [Actinoplanes couchii]MDR6316598.1 4-oxalomesaconate tautomerase [Actinoplanes couchii]GID52212.1 hypothetical protein Aco03nite_006160 [Actinoplanes couchii]
MAWIPVQVRSCGSAYFLGADLPTCPAARAGVLSALGGPAVVVDRSPDPAVDVDCAAETGRALAFPGDIVPGVGAFAVERGLIAVREAVTAVRVRMAGVVAVARVPTAPGRSGQSGPVLLRFPEPPGPPADRIIGGVPVTLIDNGRTVVIARAEEFGVTGFETPTRLEYDHRLRHQVRRLLATVGDRAELCLVAPSDAGDGLAVRVFAGDRVHPAIGVRTTLAVGAAAARPGTVVARIFTARHRKLLRLEHPSGFLDVLPGECPSVTATTRLVLDGRIPA